MKRLFAAIKTTPGEHALATYYALKGELQRERINWVVPENFHITLKFFGNTPAEKIDAIDALLGPLADKYMPFQLQLAKTGVFGSRYAPRVIWFGFDREDLLKNLGDEVLDTLDRGGFARDRQNFVPHLTIARIKEISNKKLFQAAIERKAHFEPDTITVQEMILYESILKKEGPVYLPLRTYLFNGVKSGDHQMAAT